MSSSPTNDRTSRIVHLAREVHRARARLHFVQSIAETTPGLNFELEVARIKLDTILLSLPPDEVDAIEAELERLPAPSVSQVGGTDAQA